MLSAFASTRNRRITLALLAAFVLMVVAALALGGPGHSRANLLLHLAVGTLILAFVHPWRRAREFKHLFYAAGLGFALFVILHALAGVGAEAAASIGPLHAVLQVVSVVAFFVAVFACPPALVIGLGGAVIMFVRDRIRGEPGPTG